MPLPRRLHESAKLLDIKELSKEEVIRAAADWYEENQTVYSLQEVSELFGVSCDQIEQEAERRHQEK
jgi:uncharacterized protein YjiS (DUF1127 family)